MGSAILFSKVGAVASEFPGFVLELQILLVRHGMEVDRCEAVGELAERLRTGDSTLRADLRSMITVLLFQDREVSYLEVLGLLLAATAGQEHADELAYAPGLDEPVQALFSFVVEARGSGQDEQVGARSSSAEQESQGPGVANWARDNGRFAGAAFTDTEQAGDLEGGGYNSQRSVLARALALSADGEAFGAGSLERPSSADDERRSPVPQSSAPPALASRREVTEAGTLQRTRVYAVGVSGLALGLLLGLLLSRLPGGRNVASTVRETKQMSAPAEMAERAVNRSGSGLAGNSSSGTGVVEERGKAPAAAGESSISRTLARGDAAGVDSAVAASSAPAAVPGSAGVSDSGKTVSALGKGNGSPGGMDEQPIGAGLMRSPQVEVESAGIMAANVLASPLPAYPPEASTAGVDGEVVVSAVVGHDGNVVEARVVSGPPMLREATRQAVQTWRFQPYEIGGKPMEIITTVRLEFRLSADAGSGVDAPVAHLAGVHVRGVRKHRSRRIRRSSRS